MAAAFDLKKLSTLDRVVAGASVLTLILLFLPWYGFSDGIYSASVSGFSTSYGWFGALLIIAAGVYLVLQRSGVNLAGIPVSPGVVVLGASGLGTVIVALRWLTVPSGGALGFSYGPKYGMIGTLIVGLGETACAFLLFRASGEALPWAKAGAPAGDTAVHTATMPTTGAMPMAAPMPTAAPPAEAEQSADTEPPADSAPPA